MPTLNAVSKRLLGSQRRERLDFLILFGEVHLRQVLRSWAMHGNRSRRHKSVGSGLPAAPPGLATRSITGHWLPHDVRLKERSLLNGLHHVCGLVKLVA